MVVACKHDKMKLALLFLLSILSSQILMGQINCLTGPPPEINFQDPVPPGHDLVIDTVGNPNNLWQIAAPQKPVINSAYNYNRAIITDSLSPYPVNDTSSFVIKHEAGDGYPYSHTVKLSFWYWADTDSLNDYGIIEFSPDNGSSWFNFEDPDIFWSMEWITVPPTLTGNSGGWQQAYVNTAGLGDYFLIESEDTVQFKFTFISDSIPNDRDGLAFDYFEFCDFVESVPENQFEHINSFAFPNPVRNQMTIQFDNPRSAPFELSVYNSLGQQVSILEQVTANSVFFNTETMNPGVYFYTLSSTREKQVSNNRFVILGN